MTPRRLLLALTLAADALTPAGAQPPADTLTLAALAAEAEARDPRAAQRALHRTAAALRDRNLAAERLPRLAATAEGTWQSAVPRLPSALLDRLGASAPAAPRERWQATLGADQLLHDGGRLARRRAVERARLAESEVGVRLTTFAVREEVAAAYFAALGASQREALLVAATAELDARLALVRARHRAGAALPGDTAAVRAEALRLVLQRDEAAADREAAVAVLAALVGRPLPAEARLAVPDLAAAVRDARAAGMPRARPEFARFARARERLAREADVAAAATRPRVTAFAQAGYGRPGPNVLGTDVEPFTLGGVRVQWPFLDWGAGEREAEGLRVQQRVLDTEEAAFAERLARSVADDAAAIDRLERALAVDDTIVALRERVEREARRQWEEGMLAAAEHVRRRTELTEARLARAGRSIELARARAAFLLTLGAPLR